MEERNVGVGPVPVCCRSGRVGGAAGVELFSGTRIPVGFPFGSDEGLVPDFPVLAEQIRGDAGLGVDGTAEDFNVGVVLGKGEESDSFVVGYFGGRRGVTG